MDKIRAVISKIGGLDRDAMGRAQERLDNLTKPVGSLGRLEELILQIAGIKRSDDLIICEKVVFTLAADHGVAVEGVSAFPQEVTAQMVGNFLRGGAAINCLAEHAGARVVVADVGVAVDIQERTRLVVKKTGYGTKNMAAGPAMSRAQTRAAVENGIDIFEQEFEKGVDIAGTGEMGIANTTAASAITAVLTGVPVGDITGRGTGLDQAGLQHKVEVIEKALRVNKPDAKDPFDVLARVGGFEIGGLAGIILAAASARVPVIIDGFISGSAALLAYHIEPKTKDFMIAAHRSVEKGHRVILDRIGLKSLLELDLRLGEGTGAALAMSIVDAALKVYNGMATFQGAGVSEKGA